MPQTSFRRGDHVCFRLGTRTVQGSVKEDRGPIGVKGRHLYLVEFHPESLSESLAVIELPADELQSMPDAISTP